MTDEVVVTTGARLHFGFLAHGRPGERQFGGVGAMIDRPGFIVRVSRAPCDDIQCSSWNSRIESLLARLRAAGEPDVTSGPLHVEITGAPPEHAGLGSGTQLAMAVAKAVTVLRGDGDVPHAELARRVGRGRRSSIGLYGFQHGGLLIEAGKRSLDAIGPLVARADISEEWRFLLVRPLGASGISGTAESNELSRLPEMSAELTARLCALALTEIVPAVIERDFDTASRSIGEFGRLVGEYFTPVQGGIFADEKMRRLADVLMSRGIKGVGQSSWGPTLFVLCPDPAFARDLVDDLSIAPAAADCELTIAVPLNRGASVEVR